MSLSAFHVLTALTGVLIMLFALSLFSALKGCRRKVKPLRPQHTPQQKRRTRSLVECLGQGGRQGIRGVSGVLFWSIVYPALYPLALFVGTRRVALIAPSSLATLRQLIIRHNHRCGHPVCIPVLLWPQWVVRCRGCKRWLWMREVPSLHGDVTVLQQVQGALLAAHCPVQYVEAPAAPVQPVPSAPVVAPVSPPTAQSQATQGQGHTPLA
jgi:hypothetical protein